jgi:hypothetical protein
MFLQYLLELIDMRDFDGMILRSSIFPDDIYIGYDYTKNFIRIGNEGIERISLDDELPLILGVDEL